MEEISQKVVADQDPFNTDGAEQQTQRIRRKYVRGSRPARVTRISIEHSQEDSIESVRPRLKSGVLLSPPIAEVEKSLIIATAHRAITIHHPGARAIIAKFDGEHSADEISEEIHKTTLSLPISYATKEEEVKKVIEKINSFFEQN